MNHFLQQKLRVSPLFKKPHVVAKAAQARDHHVLDLLILQPDQDLVARGHPVGMFPPPQPPSAASRVVAAGAVVGVVREDDLRALGRPPTKQPVGLG